MIELASRKATGAGSPATFRVAAIEAIPAPDDHFDAVLASMMIHHLPAELQRRGIAEVLRVLKPGGRFVAADFSATPGHGIGHVLCVFGLRKGSGHAEHLRSLAAGAGFQSIQVQAATSRAFCLLRATKPAPGQ
jgi:ubiquinone/menaquinone biosynthesis C-methylase UbiE